MDSGLIGTPRTARHDAEPLGCLSLHTLGLTVHDESAEHEVVFADGRWQCDCGYFAGHGVCAHSLAAQHQLGDLLPLADHSGPLRRRSAVAVAAMDTEDTVVPRD